MNPSRCLFITLTGNGTNSLSSFPQESKGYEFESETDTESIAKLVKYMYDNRESDDISFATLVERVTQQLVRNALTHTASPEVIIREKSLSDVFVLLPARRELLPSSSRVSTTPDRQLAQGTLPLMLSNCC